MSGDEVPAYIASEAGKHVLTYTVFGPAVAAGGIFGATGWWIFNEYATCPGSNSPIPPRYEPLFEPSCLPTDRTLEVGSILFTSGAQVGLWVAAIAFLVMGGICALIRYQKVRSARLAEERWRRQHPEART